MRCYRGARSSELWHMYVLLSLANMLCINENGACVERSSELTALC